MRVLVVEDDKRWPWVEIAVPVHNEAEVLDSSIRQLHGYLSRRFPFAWSIVIVDNASTDGTFEVAERLGVDFPEVDVIHLDAKGRGIALRTAWLRSDADVVAYTDVDLSTDLDALLPLVAPLISGHSDVAIGSRLLSAANVARGPKRETISRLYNLLLRLVFSTRVHDAQCGFKAVRTEVARQLIPAVVDDGWFFDTELLLLAEHNGLRIHEVPVDWTDDSHSKVDVRRTAIEDLKGMRRLVLKFGTGHGQVELGAWGRLSLDNDMGRRLVTFIAVGTVSTLVSLALFVLARQPLGPVLAVVFALGTTTIGNSWAHRRWTLGRQGRSGLVRHAAASGVLAMCGIGASVLMLVGVDAIGVGLLGELVGLAIAWSATTVLRLYWLANSMR
jgi:glycosyltransferase involved in cell wall biosynthesis